MTLRTRSLIRIAGLSLGLALMPIAGGGCVVMGGIGELAPLAEQTITTSAPHAAGQAIHATSTNGTISVKRAEGKEVSIVAHLKMQSDERLKATTISVNRADNVLTVKALPPDEKWKSNEGCSFEIGVPEAVAVDLRTSNGRVESSGMSGASTLATSNGAIAVKDHAGALKLRTSNGKIEGVGLSGPVDAGTSNGAVDLKLTASGVGPVDIDTSNGAITLTIPSSYLGSFSAKTSNGSVNVPSALPSGVSGNYSSEVKKSRGKVEIGSGGPASKLESSNGSITLRFDGK